MLAPEMTLAAALRDVAHADARVRGDGARNLAPALLAELQRPGPAWHADDDHPQGAEVRAALVRASLCPVRAFTSVDFPTLDRPTIAISGSPSAGKSAGRTALRTNSARVIGSRPNWPN